MSPRSNPRKPVMRLRAREAASTVILEAAEEVASQRGLDATSTAAIAERAGVAVGTLYNYFPDRDALIAALFKMRRDELVPRLVSAAEDTKHLPFEQRLRSYLAGVARAFDAFRRYCRVAINAHDTGARVPNRQTIVMDTVIAELAAILRVVAQNSAEDYARMIFGALKALMHWRLEHDEPLEPCAGLLVETFLQGVVTR